MGSGIRRYLCFVAPGERARWAGVVLLAVLGSGVEALGAVLVLESEHLVTASPIGVVAALAGLRGAQGPFADLIRHDESFRRLACWSESAV
jgi:hypothetical protein